MPGPSVATRPVIIGAGQIIRREDDASIEPAALIVDAARAAESDSGSRALALVDAVEIMAVGSVDYDDLPGLIADRLGLDVKPSRRVMHPVGGETPLRALDVAASRIASGESRVCLLAGAETTHAARHAPAGYAARARSVPRSMSESWKALSPAFAVGIQRALDFFPLYEQALRSHEGTSPDDAQRESVRMWSALSRVAAANPYAWSREEVDEATLLEVGPNNRMVALPYPKLLTANPFVNQGAALLVTDDATADALGVPADRRVYPLGGAGTDDVADPRARASYHRSPALEATMREVQEVTETTIDDYATVELYSCFPVMPKLSRRVLGPRCPETVSVTGGLTFFGGPGSDYLTHAIATMVERIRADGGAGLLHGVGMFMTKHHALVLADHPRADGSYPRAHHAVDAIRGPAEPGVVVAEDYRGPGTIETFTVIFGRDGDVQRGVVIGRGAQGERFAAGVPGSDPATLHALASGEAGVGVRGTVTGSAAPEFRC